MTENQPPVVKNQRPNLVGGLILVFIGILSLLANFLSDTPYTLWFLPALGVVFLAAGIIAGKRGLLIPGGIILGIGSGVLASETFFKNAAGEEEGGIILVAFACGWALITLLSLVVKDDGDSKVMWWPLIPGGILASVGAALLLGETGKVALEYLGQGWPVIMIAGGLYLILRRRDIQNK